MGSESGFTGSLLKNAAEKGGGEGRTAKGRIRGRRKGGGEGVERGGGSGEGERPCSEGG